MENKNFMKEGFSLSGRISGMLVAFLSAAVICMLIIISLCMDRSGLNADILNRNMSPSSVHWLGTDLLGRDMLTRIITGIYVSLKVGVFAAVLSSIIALFLGIISATAGKAADSVVTALVDMFISLPHIVLLILIAFAAGGGVKGVVIAVALSHWPRMTRVIRAEIMQIKNADYVRISYKLGRSRFWVAENHMAGFVLNQFVVGLILLFPHAILHSAGLTFLGFGLDPHYPSLGILLSESMRNISTGYWWLAVFPGAALVSIVILFDLFGSNLRKILDPRTAQE